MKTKTSVEIQVLIAILKPVLTGCIASECKPAQMPISATYFSQNKLLQIGEITIYVLFLPSMLTFCVVTLIVPTL